MKLILREKYLNQALLFKDTDLIKVITGVRRCGKSCMLKMVANKIRKDAKTPCCFIELNLESKKVKINNGDELYSYIEQNISKDKKTYIFIDEPQHISQWQAAINAVRVDFDCDIYITGSNAYLLSNELSTYLSGRYVEIKMLPLTFAEYVEFCEYKVSEDANLLRDNMENPVSLETVFKRYLKFGGFPAIATSNCTQAEHSMYCSSIKDTVLLKDIMFRKRAFNSRITDSSLLKKLTTYLADNISNKCSAKNICNYLNASDFSTTNKTVTSYLDSLCEAFLFYGCPRYDIHGKELLKTLGKFYIVDLGLRSYLMSYRATDIGRVFENAVYLQLLYRGWDVFVGKLFNKEVDFVCIKDGRTIYIQVADELFSEDTKNRELSALRSIKNLYEKFIIVRQGNYMSDIEGVKILSVSDFFLKR